jgi:hypothetical protein
MAQPLIVKLGGTDFPLGLSKVERSDLYGFIEVEALDDKGRKCSMATLADDGKTIIASQGISLVTLTPDGEWLEKKTLIPTDGQGKTITPVASSYSAPVPLETRATIEEYLSHNIRAVYQISSEADLGPLLDELKKGTIFQFPYSFRGGLEPDAGFILMSSEGKPFVAIGSATKLEFVGLEEAAGVTAADDGGEEDDDSLDFNMM